MTKELVKARLSAVDAADEEQRNVLLRAADRIGGPSRETPARYCAVMGGARPSGTVTFLFTDIEDSTVLWDRSQQAMTEALSHHDRLIRVQSVA